LSKAVSSAWKKCNTATEQGTSGRRPGCAQLLVRDLEDAVVHALRQKAAEEGTSVEEAHRRILRLALFSKKPKKGFKEFLLEMPEGGDDSIFDRHRSQPPGGAALMAFILDTDV
jgi:antitoxin FitA